MTRPLVGVGPVPCEHSYQYAGVRFADGSHPLPGTGATRRFYAHVYFCTKCTSTRGEPIPDKYGNNNSYQPLKYNATPGTLEVCGGWE